MHGAPTVNPERTGTKAALWYRLDVPAGETSVLRVRLSAGSTVPGDVALGGGFDEVVTARKGEADAYYAALTPAPTTDDEALVLRQALAGMLWGKQFLHYDVARWLDGDPRDHRRSRDPSCFAVLGAPVRRSLRRAGDGQVRDLGG